MNYILEYDDLNVEYECDWEDVKTAIITLFAEDSGLSFDKADFLISEFDLTDYLEEKYKDWGVLEETLYKVCRNNAIKLREDIEENKRLRFY